MPFIGGFKGYMLSLLAFFPLFTPCFALVVLALAAGAARWLDRPGWRFLGEASYALYITHLLPYYLLAHDLLPGWRAHPVAWALGAMGGSLVLAAAAFRWVETPARRWLRPPALPRELPAAAA